MILFKKLNHKNVYLFFLYLFLSELVSKRIEKPFKTLNIYKRYQNKAVKKMQLKPCKKIRQSFILWLPKDNCNIARKSRKIFTFYSIIIG